AVPGSGKTFTLSLLAAQLVQRLAGSGPLDEREVLVVTFTNSAVENFRTRINQFMHQQGLLPGVGYRVRTLHGLAHDIVRERPGLVGLSEEFDIVDDRTAEEIKREAVIHYLQSHPDAFGPFIRPEFLANPRRIERRLLNDAFEIAAAVIRTAKNLRTDPTRLRRALEQQSGAWPLLDFGLRVFADYQRSLHMRGALDFDDLIVLALQALEADQDFLARLQARWPYVLEDEAQDSSLLQEQMLSLLTAAHGNWVRVGDPNQAINTTFTSADPAFLRRFIARPDVEALPLPNSGRSAQPIIELANRFAAWSRTQHPVLPPEMALTPPDIRPTEPGDPQPNPPLGPGGIVIYDEPLSPDREIHLVVQSLRRWLGEHPDKTCAVLVPDNARGFVLASALERAQIPFDDTLLRSSSSTRAAAQALAQVLLYISAPQRATHLDKLWTDVWWPRKGQPSIPQPDQVEAILDDKLPEPVHTFARALGKLNQPERFLFPEPGDEWLDEIGWLADEPFLRTLTEQFRDDLRRWTGATVLPIDELILTLAGDLFDEPVDLALAHSIALLLARRAQERPHLRLPELAQELQDIAQNRRRVLGFNEDVMGFEPPPGKATVATMHGAKGLEWDRVYLLSVSAYSFPSGGDEEAYRSEPWYARDSLNLTAEAIAQVEQLHMGTLDEYTPGAATRQARLDIAAERLRLLYVGITRAREELIVTYNTGRGTNGRENPPALALQVLKQLNPVHSKV
ncbi:MAG: ATP-dependent helicase, partial [Caldilineae bacterium]